MQEKDTNNNSSIVITKLETEIKAISLSCIFCSWKPYLQNKKACFKSI